MSVVSLVGPWVVLTNLHKQLPGYGRTDYPINVCNDKAERDNVTKHKLARNVAKGVRKALQVRRFLGELRMSILFNLT